MHLAGGGGEGGKEGYSLYQKNCGGAKPLLYIF